MTLGSLTRGPHGLRYIIREYTSSETWTKQPGLKMAFIVCVGAGGGGGSGRRGAASSVRTGGAGGGGGAIATRWLMASEIGATVTITVGAGGAGGAAQTANSTDGDPGGSGTSTSFGTLVVGRFGGGGGAGRTSASVAGTGGSITNSTPDQFPTVAGVNGSTGAVSGSGNAASTVSMQTLRVAAGSRLAMRQALAVRGDARGISAARNQPQSQAAALARALLAEMGPATTRSSFSMISR
jgi:hypothetical protein